MACSLLSFSQARSQPSEKCIQQHGCGKLDSCQPRTEAYSQILELSPGDEAATLGLAAAYRGV
jgi:hypothetical protein